MAVKERGEFSDISVINYFNSNPTEGFVLGNLLGYRTTFEGTKTKEALEQEKAENKTGNFIYDLNDTPGVLNEHAKNRAAASRLFSVLGISNLCTNSRIAAVKDANGKLTFGTKSEKLHSQTFESGSNVALYSELKEKIKNDADGTNGDIRFSAEAMSDLSTIKLMNALMGGMGYRHRRERYSYRDGTVFFYLSNSEQ
ncbi:MAG: hypothetical protein J6P45_07920 [Lachnospiraceae bacterium]|nr:hypothetical protein [Lachnospiraceae bacterium]